MIKFPVSHPKSVSRQRVKSLMAGALMLGVGGAIASGGMIVGAPPVLADAVKIQAPQAPGFADVVEAVTPAVVSVRVEAKLQNATNRGNRSQRGFDDLPKDHPLRKFFDEQNPFGDQFNRRDRRRGGQQRPRRPRRFGTSQGSGFFVSEDGYVVTNNHVVEGGSKFTVVTTSGAELDAKLIGTDPKTDLAVLKVSGSQKFTYVDFTETKARVGDWVVAIGNPFGLGGTVTAGIVSAHGRDIGSGPYDDFIQIDAAVNKGNSGGPAFNLSGEVIGVNTAIFSPSGGNVGIAFAIPASTARAVVDQLINGGSVTRGWLGVRIQSVSKDIAASLGFDSTKGAMVSEPTKGSPADKAGIKTGDIITSVDGKSIKSPKQLAKVIAAYAPNDKAKVSIWRDGTTQNITVELGKLPRTQSARAVTPEAPVEKSALEGFGIELSAGREGVVVATVEPGSDAEKKGFRKGNIIVSVNGRPTPTLGDVDAAISSALDAKRKAVLFQVKSPQGTRFVALPVAKG